MSDAELTDVQVEGETQSSAWAEQTSAGKFKFGCKCYRLDVDDAVSACVKAFMRQKNIIEKIEKQEAERKKIENKDIIEKIKNKE